MSDYRSKSRDDHRGNNISPSGGGGSGNNSNDEPPMSRLFIVCDRAHTEDDLRQAFKAFGEIENIWVVKDKNTQENKGIAYVKFAKTSGAAKALEEMDGKTIGKSDRRLKVLVAANRNQGSNQSDTEQEKHVRLFIVISKQATEVEILEEFKQWGDVESVKICKDKVTGQSKGFGYVLFAKFSHAALAFENCSTKFKVVFAEPKGSNSTKRYQNGRLSDDNLIMGISRAGGNSSNNNNSNMAGFLRMKNVPVAQKSCLEVIVSNTLNQDQLWRLFDIIPSLDYCEIKRECGPKTNEASVVYNNPEAAIYAKDKLHGFEYPVGERIIVKVSDMSAERMDSSLIEKHTKNDSICNVTLPPAQPMASSDATVEQRLFIVLTSNVPQSVLKNVFSRWKGLIDAYLLQNKNYGYVKYAESESAEKAIQILNGAEICGAKIKVMEAEERRSGGGDDDNSAKKRLRRN